MEGPGSDAGETEGVARPRQVCQSLTGIAPLTRRGQSDPRQQATPRARLAQRWHVANGRRTVHPKRRHRISGQWSPRLIEMLESPAYRALSRTAHMVISRIEIELGHHGGNDNGRLPVTTDDFVEYGMHRTSVAPAIREAEAPGFIRVTERGRGGNAERRAPKRFFLTFAHGRDSRATPATHDWRHIESIEQAQKIARAARSDKDPNAVAQGKRSWHKRGEKQKAGTEIFRVSIQKTCTERVNTPVRKNQATSLDEKTVLLSIARGGSGAICAEHDRLNVCDSNVACSGHGARAGA
jgi:hypothetical protein